jgi:purine-binding chemotaxis protein CheW
VAQRLALDSHDPSGALASDDSFSELYAVTDMEHKTMNDERNDKPMTGTEESREYLTFTLGDEEYGIDILKTQEIRSYDTVTKIANAPAFIKGVINMRGIIVPIIDMRLKFSLGQVEYNRFTVVIILNITGRVIGIVVDGVSDVIALGGDQIRPAPEFGALLDTAYIEGLATLDQRMVILVDIERLMTSGEMGLVEQMQTAAG